MTIINHYQSIIFIGKIANFSELCDKTVHRKYSVSDDDSPTKILSLFQNIFQLFHI